MLNRALADLGKWVIREEDSAKVGRDFKIYGIHLPSLQKTFVYTVLEIGSSFLH